MTVFQQEQLDTGLVWPVLTRKLNVQLMLSSLNNMQLNTHMWAKCPGKHNVLNRACSHLTVHRTLYSAHQDYATHNLHVQNCRVWQLSVLTVMHINKLVEICPHFHFPHTHHFYHSWINSQQTNCPSTLLFFSATSQTAWRNILVHQFTLTLQHTNYTLTSPT